MIVAVVVIVLVVVGVVIYLLNRPAHHPAPVTVRPKAQVNDQSLDPSIFKNFLESNNLTENTPATLVVGTNTIFSGSVTMQGSTNINGALTLGSGLTVKSGQTTLSGLQVSGAATMSQLTLGSNLNVNGTTNLQGNVVAEQGLTVHGNLAVLGTFGVTTLTATTATVSGQLNIDGHLATGGTTPGVQVGVGSGGGSATISGNDTAGTVIIETNSPSAGGTLATVTFARGFSSVPHVIISPDNMDAGKVQWYVTRAASFFTIESETAAPAGSSLTFDYFVAQ
jgi:hypothetical protein